MRSELKKTVVMCLSVFVAALAVIVVASFLIASGAFGADNLAVQYVPLAIAFIAIMLMSFRLNGFWDLRGKYKEHCKRFNISAADMQDLEHGKL